MMRRIELDDKRDFLVWRQGSGHTVEIFDIAVGSERRQGKGRKLVNILIGEQLPEGTRLVWAICRSDNLIGMLFYEEMGFHVVGALRSFYRDQPGLVKGVDAHMWGRNIE